MDAHFVAQNRHSQTIVNALVLLGLLALARASFCFSMPNLIGGWRVLSTDLDLGLMSIPYILCGYYCIVVKGWPRVGLLVITPGLYCLSGISTFRLQVDVFHFGRTLPLIDDVLGAADAALGFDWTAYFFWTMQNETFFEILTIAYHSIWVQPFLLCAVFALSGKIREYFTVQTALPLSFALTCAIAAFLPALGAYQYHGMGPGQHPGITLEFTDQMSEPMLWLRQARLPNTLPAFADLRLITFPSWHAAAAVIFMMAAWPVKRLGYAMIVLNALMLMATPVQGSHYLTDMIIGGLVGYVSFVLGKRIVCWPKNLLDLGVLPLRAPKGRIA